MGAFDDVPTEDVLDLACERIRQLLVVIEHADREHDGKLMDHEGEVENAHTFLNTLNQDVAD